MITGEQVKAARALLGWTQGELAAAARVSRTSVIICGKGRAPIGLVD
jgi:DNA-binding XRE family transcriptional regulator